MYMDKIEGTYCILVKLQAWIFIVKNCYYLLTQGMDGQTNRFFFCMYDACIPVCLASTGCAHIVLLLAQENSPKVFLYCAEKQACRTISVQLGLSASKYYSI